LLAGANELVALQRKPEIKIKALLNRIAASHFNGRCFIPRALEIEAICGIGK